MSHTIAVQLFTYNRHEYMRRTLAALRTFMRSGNPIILHIADDGSDDQDAIIRQANHEASTGYWKRVTMSNTERRGYGASYNEATRWTHSEADILLPLEDDWELLREFHPDQMIAALEESDGEYDCIRLGYIGFTQELRAKFVRLYGQNYLHLLPESPEPHVFSGGPRIETRARQRRVGLWPEGLQAGQTEFAVAHRPAARERVLWPIDLVRPYGDLFGHFGAISVNNIEPKQAVRNG